MLPLALTTPATPFWGQPDRRPAPLGRREEHVLDFLFGEGQYGLRFLFAFIVVLGLIGLTAWLGRRFGATHLGATAARGRQPRLAVIDAAAVDGRRRLVLIRRDNVEHLLMIGGPTDVVIEPNIVRAASAREVPGRQPAAADTLPRP